MANSKDKPFYINLSAQTAPKPTPMNYYIRRADETSRKDYTVLGYEFTEDLRHDSYAKIEGYSLVQNFRRALLPEEGHYWLSRDFSGQELRVTANLSMEQTWISTFLNGGDLHEATAKLLWGAENYDKSKRKAAKAINFGLLYGKTYMSLADDLGISEVEAKGYIDNFFEKLPSISRFMRQSATFTQNNKYLRNHYGRIRRFHNYFDKNGRLSPSGERASFNFPIQSLGADIIKVALIKVYDNILAKPEYEGKVKFLSTIHDEVNFSVSYDLVEKIAYETGKLMTHIIPNKPVPIITGLEIGHSMGLTWTFNQDPETLELTPDGEDLNEEEKEEVERLKSELVEG